MKRSIERTEEDIKRLPLITAAVMAIISLLLVSCGDGGGGNGGGTPASTVELVACPVSGTTDVSVQDFSFSPSSVTGTVNTIVKWTNSGSAHTVTSATVPANGAFNSSLGVGASVCFKFTATGTFSYFCSIHPVMTGTVTIQ